jgi:DegV family protein with EDD domain
MIGLITDSTCDIPNDLIQQYGIAVLPCYIIWGGKQYKDRVELSPLDFYNRLKIDPTRPTTSQPTVGDLLDLYGEMIEKGFTELLVITISSAMSGTYMIAKNAAELVKCPVQVVDAKGPTMTLGWQVLVAARAIEAGADMKTVLAEVEKARSRMVQFVAIESMEYLQRGGRIGGAIKWVGSFLQIKPLVSINHNTGLVEAETIARSHKSLVDQMVKRFFSHLKTDHKLRIAVLHGNVQDKAKELARRIQEEYHPLELIINMTGPVLGNNTGPGALALCGYYED